MTSNALRPPPNLQPRPKAAATSRKSSLAAVSASTPQSSRAPSPSPAARRAKLPTQPVDTNLTSTTSNTTTAAPSADDKATISLIRRTLCAHHQTYSGETGSTKSKPLEELLPPLTSSNEVDLQLYAFIAIIVREFVNPWYARITPDQVFVDEVIQIIAHCTRAIEERLRKVDLEALLLDRIPRIVDAHFDAYRTSHRSLHILPVAPDPRYVYHAIHPHPALSPVPDPAIASSIEEQRHNEVVYRHTLVQKALAILLPAEDLENACLRTLVGDIFSEMILGRGISEKACEAHTWWNGITKLAEALREHLRKTRHESASGQRESTPRGPSAPSDTDDAAEGQAHGIALSLRLQRSAASQLLWRLVQYGMLALSACRFLVIAIAAGPSLPSASTPSSPIKSPASPLQRSAENAPKQLFHLHIFPAVSNVLDLPARMPWLTGMLELLQWILPAGPGCLRDVDGLLKKRIPQHVPTLLSISRNVLFPNNTLPRPSSQAASTSGEDGDREAAEAAAALSARAHCAQTILSVLPPVVRKTYFGTADETAQQRDLEETVLVPLAGGGSASAGAGDPWIVRHLVFEVVETVLVAVLPELADEEED